MRKKREIEEILELIWTLNEEKRPDKRLLLELTTEVKPEELLTEMEDKGLVLIDNNMINLTPAGEKYARMIVRRHRLAERLFKDVFQMSEESLEKEACTWEHVLSAEVTDSVCSFLGHPRVCPHNNPIPPGNCCFKYKKDVSVAPLVQPLTNSGVGNRVKIVYILPSIQKRLERLTNLGILPGNYLMVRQKYPALVVQCDETTIALDSKIGDEIYVIQANGDLQKYPA